MIKKLADRLFKWYCRPEYYPDIKGDLEELYYDQVRVYPRMANLFFLFEVVRLFRPALIRPLFKNSFLNSSGMFKNYFKISLRNLIKHRAFSAINITGLAVGLTAFLMINQYVEFEKSYDRFFSNPDRLYRLTTDQVLDGVIGTRDAMSFAPSGPLLVQEVPEIVSTTLTFQFSELVLKKGDRSMRVKRAIAADSNYFDLFDYKILSGDVKTMLKEPQSIVLTASKAFDYFGDQDPVGQTLEVLGNDKRFFKVTGVMEDMPENTHYKFDLIMSMSSLEEMVKRDAWRSFNYYTYLKIAPQADIEEIRKKMPSMSKFDEETDLEFNLQAVEDIHLYSDFTYEPEVHGSANVVNFLSIISILIIVVAWVNYINLSTARAIDRAREVGVRKAIGARKKQLVVQFLFESLLLNMMAAVLAILLAQLFYPTFNQLIGKDVITDILTNNRFLISVFVFAFIGAIVSGIYPAFVLSNFKAVIVLKGKFRNSAKGAWLRKGLVVVQFAVSLVLLAATFVINQQVSYMQSADKGLDMDYVVGFRRPSRTDANREVIAEKIKQFKQSLRGHHAIQSVGMANVVPGGFASEISSTTNDLEIVGKTKLINGTSYIQGCDDKFFEAVGIRMIAGRNFNAEFAGDTAAIIVNESFLKRMGIQDFESVLNEQIRYGEDDEYKFRIIGVIADYNRTSLKNKVEPTATFYQKVPRNVVVRFHQANYHEGVDYLEKTYQEYFPNTPLDYAFLDERFKALFREDQQFGRVMGTFSLLAVIVASLGLFGLSAFMAMNRAKEVGIRKVLGASITQILIIFYSEFVVLIIIASLIGVPLTYFSMEDWLNNYAYRVDFPWAFMIVSFLVVLISALLTVGYQTIRVAVKNPSQTLRYE